MDRRGRRVRARAVQGGVAAPFSLVTVQARSKALGSEAAPVSAPLATRHGCTGPRHSCAASACRFRALPALLASLATPAMAAPATGTAVLYPSGLEAYWGRRFKIRPLGFGRSPGCPVLRAHFPAGAARHRASCRAGCRRGRLCTALSAHGMAPRWRPACLHCSLPPLGDRLALPAVPAAMLPHCMPQQTRRPRPCLAVIRATDLSSCHLALDGPGNVL